MIDWLQRAKREISKSARRDTAVTDERNLTAAMAVRQPSESAGSGACVLAAEVSAPATYDTTLSVSANDHPASEREGLRSSSAEARRQRLLAMLAEHPGTRYAVVTDDADPAYADCVVLGIGIRQESGSLCTADLIVPKESYDGIKLLELLERRTQGNA